MPNLAVPNLAVPNLTPRRRALAVTAVAIVALLTGAGAIAYRVLAPAEVVTVTDAGIPGPARARPGVIGSLAAAPLIVEGRVRVYATKRQLRADGPADAHTQRSPLWSYRRWPAQLVGVVAAGPTVVSQWSDGRLVAVDALTGRVAWRANGPAPETPRYTGRRTGAQTVYAPEGLFTAEAAGTPVVLVDNGGEIDGFDAATGHRLWRTAFQGGSPGCRSGGFTTSVGFVVRNGCEAPHTLEFYDLATGGLTTRWRPPGAGPELAAVGVGCDVGRSRCRAMRVRAGGAGQGWLLGGSAPVRAAALDPSTAVLAGDVAVDAPDGAAQLTGRSVRTGAALWTGSAGPVAVVAAEPGAVHAVTSDRWLVTLDPATGSELSRFPLVYPREPDGLEWRPGHVHARNRFVLIERLHRGAPATASDDEYYAIDQPVLLVGT